jgi:hypothetical protein
MGNGLNRRLRPDRNLQQFFTCRGPAFKVRLDQGSLRNTAILYLEPLDRRNEAAIGFEMFSKPTASKTGRLATPCRKSKDVSSLIEESQTTMQTAGRDHTIQLDAGPTKLTTDKAVCLGVIVTELDSYKYANPDGTLGDIRVKIAKKKEDRALLVVEGDGVGLDASSAPRGTGIDTKRHRYRHQAAPVSAPK